MKIGQFVILPADSVLGCVAEPAVVTALPDARGVMSVRQTTWANGEPGEFQIDVADFRALFPC